jgi:hypothetical protein
MCIELSAKPLICLNLYDVVIGNTPLCSAVTKLIMADDTLRGLVLSYNRLDCANDDCVKLVEAIGRSGITELEVLSNDELMLR